VIVVLQFPLADSRRFRAGCDGRLDVPHWPTPVTQIRPEFVHFFGRAVERRRGADQAWTDEMCFCLARRAIRFDDLGAQRVGPPSAAFRPAAAFRRLFSDGSVVSRVEIGLAHNRLFQRLGEVTAEGALAIATDLCALPTWVPGGTGPERQWKPLLRQGPALAHLYRRASSATTPGAAAVAGPCDALVRPGNPVLLIELHASTRVELPSSFTTLPVESTRGATLAFGRLRTKAGVVNTWVVHPGRAERTDLRSLRLCLMRLHAEQEALDIVLQELQARRILSEPSIDIADDLNGYLNKATRLIGRESWAGISQSAIVSAFEAAEQVTPAASRANRTERFDGARRQVWRKIEDYQARRAAIRVVSVTNVERGATYVEKSVTTNVTGHGNIVNVADFMSNVTNTVNQQLTQSAAPDDVQALIKQLVKQIEEIATKIEPQKTQQLGADVEALTKEVTSPQPRKKWYELALESIKETATTIGEVGKPILDTVKTLAPLLAAFA
jgi:hypothetical protein